MEFEYDIFCVVDMGQICEPVNKLQKELNSVLSMHRVDESIRIESRMSLWVMSAGRELTELETDQLKSIIHSQLLESDVSFKAAISRVEVIRRKPGNVSFVSP